MLQGFPSSEIKGHLSCLSRTFMIEHSDLCTMLITLLCDCAVLIRSLQRDIINRISLSLSLSECHLLLLPMLLGNSKENNQTLPLGFTPPIHPTPTTHPFTQIFIQHVFIEHPLCMRPCIGQNNIIPDLI